MMASSSKNCVRTSSKTNVKKLTVCDDIPMREVSRQAYSSPDAPATSSALAEANVATRHLSGASLRCVRKHQGSSPVTNKEKKGSSRNFLLRAILVALGLVIFILVILLGLSSFNVNIQVEIAKLTFQIDNLKVKVNSSFALFARGLFLNKSAIKSCPGLDRARPASSCAEVYKSQPAAKSGYYWIRSSVESSSGKGSIAGVYCQRSLPGSLASPQAGWMRVAQLRKDRHGEHCFRGINQNSTANTTSCAAKDGNTSNFQTSFSTLNLPYSRVYLVLQVNTWNVSQTSDGSYPGSISISCGDPGNQTHLLTCAFSRNCCNSNGNPGYASSDFYCCNVGSLKSTPATRANRNQFFLRRLPAKTAQDIEMKVVDIPSNNNNKCVLETLEIYVK